MSEPDVISIRGAAEHNLKSIDIDIPKKQLVVLTGVSGSGKSSLAFDTLYAEGQRRYVESLSAYARQFLGQQDKPKYGAIRGLSPSIAIEQKSASNNPRSTVGTVTEIHDYLRVLYASIGVRHCPKCGRIVGRQSAQQIVEEIEKLPAGTKFMLLAPVVSARKGEYKDVLTDLKRRGLVRVRVDGKMFRLDEDEVTLSKKLKHSVHVVIERLVMKEGLRARLTDAVETALKEGKGLVTLTDEKADPKRDRVFSELNACTKCGLSFDELVPNHFSFNNPMGMCPECNGLGTRLEMDPELVVPDKSLSIRGGAVEPWAKIMAKESYFAGIIEGFADSHGIDLDTPWEELPAAHRDLILNGSGKRIHGIWFEGVLKQLMRRYMATESEEMRQYYGRYASTRVCGSCHGGRLKPESAAVRVGGKTLVEFGDMNIREALTFLEGLSLSDSQQVIAGELLKEIKNRLRFLCDVGLSYLTLSRGAASLSGGEGQRIRLASQIGTELTGVIYILDEPSIGLHQRDNDKLLATLKKLRDLGNSVVVVEHDEDTIRSADWIADFGPGAGSLGGELVAKGSVSDIMDSPRSITGAYLSGRMRIETPKVRRTGDMGRITVRGARENNLKNIDVSFPLGRLVAVTGVSGAGKSSLVNGILRPALMRQLNRSLDIPGAHDGIEGTELLDKVIAIDQQPIGRTPRSNPATYTKLFDPIRELYAETPEARAFGYGPGRFSFNLKGGRCEACQGAGVKTVEMHFLADVQVVCEECRGRRFNDATLRVAYKGKNIAELLEMRVQEALDFFSGHRELTRVLKTLDDVGLSYLSLGQPAPTLSGGEAQRIKLSRELCRVATGKTLYILDEPTTGLHFEDIRKLLIVLNRLVDAGNTVVVIEHNLDVIRSADWVIDLGPEGGSGGGRLVAEGTPEEVARSQESATGRYLKKVLGI